MKPVLVALDGPLKGTSFPLDVGEITMGRESSNEVCLRDFAVSRHHCAIRPDGENFVLSDLDSTNGSFINDVPVKRRTLQDQDRIRIGDSIFLFLVDADSTPHPETQAIREVEIVSRTTIQLSPDEGLYSKLAEVPRSTRHASDLQMLLKISTLIHQMRSIPGLQKELLRLTLQVVPAEQGAVLILDERSPKIESIEASDPATIVSRTMVQETVEKKQGLLRNDILGELDQSPDSMRGSRISSLLTVPMMIRNQVCGVFYFYTSEPATTLDESHLQLVTGIACMAGIAVENIRHWEWMQKENRRLKTQIGIESNMVGESKVMQDVYRLIAKVAPVDSTVLIRGESGTGKELVASAIHQNSPRSEKPFVVVNCAALPESLLESELFGHEKGAFTGAISSKQGKLEVADGGTVFLDEIGEIPFALQAKLLRVLQEKELERVGANFPVPVDVRFIAATNRNLEERIRKGTFREDLFYRLNVVSITVPALRERREDIPLLASFFVGKYAAKANRVVKGFSEEVRSYLLAYDWPGNVRELENTIERAVVLGSGECILAEDLPEVLLEQDPDQSSLPMFQREVQQTKKRVIVDALRQTGGNHTEAAKILGIHVNHLHRLIRNLNIPKRS